LSQKKIGGKFWFTTQTSRPSFGSDFDFITSSVSHDPTRKQFFAKLLGAAAVASLAPKLVAKSSLTTAAAPVSSAPVRFQLRSDTRAVTRRPDSV
jgi:hypothetical protein